MAGIEFIHLLNAVLGIAILSVIVWLTWQWLRMGNELFITRMNILQVRTLRGFNLFFVGILFLIVSVLGQLYQDITGRAWIIDHDVLMSAFFASLLAGLLIIVPVVRVPSTALR